MSHDHERGRYARDANRVDLDDLLVMGKKYQKETGWKPVQAKNIGTPKPKKPIEGTVAE